MLKRIGVNAIPTIEEVNIFKDDIVILFCKSERCNIRREAFGDVPWEVGTICRPCFSGASILSGQRLGTVRHLEASNSNSVSRNLLKFFYISKSIPRAMKFTMSGMVTKLELEDGDSINAMLEQLGGAQA